jgi:hypothetical protein
MGCPMRVGLLVIVTACAAPPPTYALVNGPGSYTLQCQDAMAQCDGMARNLCADGYEVSGTKSGALGSSMTIHCVAPKKRTNADGAVATVATSAEPVERKPSCTQDYQCTAMSSRCVNGECVVVPATPFAEESDKCVVGDPDSPDPVPLFPTTAALTEFLGTPPTSKGDLFQLVTRLGGVWVDVGVRCRTLGQFARGRRVQLVSGTLAGRDGWIASAPVEPMIAPAAGAPAAPGAAARK